jgi:hypothetical protein
VLSSVPRAAVITVALRISTSLPVWAKLRVGDIANSDTINRKTNALLIFSSSSAFSD